MLKSFHLRRIFFLIFVSLWLSNSAFGLDAKTDIEQAHAFYKQKQHSKVTPLLWKNIESLQKKDFHILLRSHLEQDQGDDLLRVSDLLIAKNEKDFEAHHFRGKALVIKKKEKEGLESLKRALELNPKYLPSYLSIADIYEKKKNLYELRSIYQDMEKAFGPTKEILAKLCQFHAQDGLNESAERYCQKAIQKDDTLPDNQVYLGMVYVQSGEREKGKETFKQVSDKFIKSELAQFTYAKLLEDEKNYVDSFKVYGKCLSVDEKSERCLVGYGNSAFQIQKYSEAHDTYKKLCKINRNFSIHVRKSLASLRASGPAEWSRKFQDLSDFCSM